MRNTLKSLALLNAIYGSELNAAVEVATQPLDPSNRPQWMQTAIAATANRIMEKQTLWDLNGQELYGLGKIDEHRVIIQQIARAFKEDPSRKEFWVLDVGCAEFKWGKALQDKLNGTFNNQEIDIHVVGMTGGYDTGLTEEDKQKGGVVHLHAVEGFQIENIASLFSEGDESVEFDAIVSRSTFQHLADPLGTLISLVNLLRRSGVLICDFPQLLILDNVGGLFSNAYYGKENDRCEKQNQLLVIWGDTDVAKDKIAYRLAGPVNRMQLMMGMGETENPKLLTSSPPLALSMYTPALPEAESSQEAEKRFGLLPKIEPSR